MSTNEPTTYGKPWVGSIEVSHQYPTHDDHGTMFTYQWDRHYFATRKEAEDAGATNIQDTLELCMDPFVLHMRVKDLETRLTRATRLEEFAQEMAEYDCAYESSQPCLSVHVSKLSHGMCIACRAREALQEAGIPVKTY